MAIIAFSTFARVGVNGDTGALFEVDNPGAYGDYPWEVDDVAVAESSDGRTFSADGDAVIRVPSASTDPIQIAQVTDVDVRLSMTASGDIDPAVPAEDREWPETVGYPEDDIPIVAFPYAGTLELWVEADEAWTLTIADLAADEITDTASGQGNALLVYSGESVSATFEFAGEGIFFVTTFTREGGEESLIIDSGALTERHSWQPSESVVFRIESDADRGAWVVDIDSYAEDEPSPTPSASTGTEPPSEQE
jgi:hypothetical protein